VVIACYTEDRWELTLRAISSAQDQSHAADRILVVVDYNEILSTRLRVQFDDIIVLDNYLERGVSGARNSAVARVETPVVAFLDDDATARGDWLERLVAPFDNPLVVGTGGAIEPAWEQPPPPWFPPEFAWVVGGTYRGLPTKQEPIRNVWSGNMAIRRSVFNQVGGFRRGFGKVGGVARPEDTDVCIRMGKVFDGGHWVFVPDALVDHFVPVHRESIQFFLRRCHNEGRGKIELSSLLGSRDDLGPEREYIRSVVPRGIRDQLRASLQTRKAEPLVVAGAMLLGLGAAAVGAGEELSRSLIAQTSSKIRRSKVRGPDLPDAASPPDEPGQESGGPR